MCSFDSSYFENNYAYVCDEKGQIFKFKNRLSQKIFDSVIAEFDQKQVSIEILCLDPDTKVLTADLRWVRIDDVNVGDELVAVDEGETLDAIKKKRADRFQKKSKGTWVSKPSSERLSDRKMRTTRVEAKWNTFDHGVRVTFDDGRILTGSPNHMMLAKQRGGCQPEWRKLKDFTVGEEIRWVTKPWNESGYEDGWAGGVMDGEGSFRRRDRAGVEATISQTINAVYWRMRDYLLSRKYNVREALDTRAAGEKSKLGKKDVGRFHLGRLDELFRFIGQTRPARFIGNRFWEGKSLPGKNSGQGWAKIISIELIPQQRLVEIQTSHKTFIAEGFVSHNCLKARQVGVTTKVALKFIHRMLFMPHTQSVMASVDSKKSELIGRILDTAHDFCPFWLVPIRTKDSQLAREYANKSILSIQSGSQATGLAQGWTPTNIHVSELADLKDAKKTIEEGLLRATHSSRHLFMVLEGTGGGNTGWLADTWRTSKKDWPSSRLCPIFIPWAMVPDLYPEEDWVRKFPIPDDWHRKISDITRKHVTRCESYIRNTPYLAKVVGRNWRMPVEQQWFWQFNYDAACQNHTQKIWLAQMAADDFEALTGVHDTVFDPEVISELENNVYEVIGEGTREEMVRREPLQAYAITGHSVEDVFEPDESQIDYDKQIITVEWKSNRGEEYSWDMIPLLPINEDVEKDTFDKLLVYEEPKSGYDYACGVDTADGLDKEDEERACASISKVGTGSGYDEQVCELTSRRMNPAQMVPFVACMATWYGRRTKDQRGVKFAIEQVRGPGDTCQNQLKIMGFNYHHAPRRYDSKKIKDESKHKQGWYSTSWSVPMLMTSFVEAVNGGWYIPKSKWLIEECKTLERHITGSKSKMEHREGQFDDRVRAAAQSYFTTHDLDDFTQRSQKRYALPKRKQKDPNEGRCLMNAVSVFGDDE